MLDFQEDIFKEVGKLKGLSLMIILSGIWSSIHWLVVVWFRFLSYYREHRRIYSMYQGVEVKVNFKAINQCGVFML